MFICVVIGCTCIQEPCSLSKVVPFATIALFFRSSPPKVFLGKGFLKIYSKLTEEHPCQSVIPITLLCNFIEITLQHGCFSVNLMIFSEHLFLKTRLKGCFWFLCPFLILVTAKRQFKMNHCS